MVGIARYTYELYTRACDLDPELSVEIRVFGAEPPPLAIMPRHPSIAVRRFPDPSRVMRPGRAWGWHRVEAARRQVIGRLWGTGPAVWHSTFYTLPSAGWDGPVVTTCHDLIYHRLPHLHAGDRHDQARRQMVEAVERADLVLCVSEATRDDVVALTGVPASRCRVTPLAHSDVFRPLAASERGEPNGGRPYVLYVGSRYQHKGFATLLSAYAWWGHRGEVDLVVVGPPLAETERAAVEQLGVAGRVRTVDGVDDEALCQLYNGAVALVHTSLIEGFGIPLLEAMACQCPIVATAIPTTKEVAGDVPIYAEPACPETLRDGLDRALDEDHAERVARGTQRAGSFSWVRTAAETLAAYRSIQ